MSKEMTPKEALRRISGFISFCCYEYFDKELEKDWKKDIDAITQELDRLESLEKIFSDSHTCEIKARFNEIECSADKCDNCPLSIGDDICLKKTFEKKWELQKENQELLMAIENKNNEIKNLKKLIHDNPYKKVITWLKNTFEIILDSKVRISDGTDCIQAFPIDLKTNEVIYDLLKEVLESV